MGPEEHVYSVLIVSASEKFDRSLAELLPSDRFHPILSARDSGTARRECLNRRFDLVLINTPLGDDFGVSFALDLTEDSGTGILLFVRAEHFPDICAKVSSYGILTLSKPTVPSMIQQSVQLLCSTRERLRRMEAKTASVEDKMQEIRIVNRAKWLLIGELNLTESEAHRYIEKQAMDRCISRRAVAEKIIHMYQR